MVLSTISFTSQTTQTEQPKINDGSKLTKSRLHHNHLSPMANDITADQTVYTKRTFNLRLSETVHLTLTMTSTKVVEMSVVAFNNGPFLRTPSPRRSDHAIKGFTWTDTI